MQIGIILSATPVMMLLIQPIYGMLADRIGIKKCLIFSSLLASLSFLLFLLDGGFYFLLLVTLLMSVFYNALQPFLDSVTLELTEGNPNFSYGTLRIAGAAGWAFTGIIVGYFITTQSTMVIFVSSSISLMIAFFVSLSLDGAEPKRIVAHQNSEGSFKSILKNKTLVFLLISIFLISVGATTIWNFYSIYMKENGASATLVGYGLSFQGLTELPMFYFSARIIKRFGIKSTLLITIAATTIRLFLYSWVKDPQAAIAIELLHCVSWSLFWVVCVESVNGLVPTQWRATGQSILYAVYFGAGQIAGNFWTGWLYDQQMTIANIFMLNGFLVAGVGVLTAIFLRPQKVNQTATAS